MTASVDSRLSESVRKVLKQIRDTGPDELVDNVTFDLRRTEVTPTEAEIIAAVTVPELNDPARREMHMALAVWDAATSQEWVGETSPATPDRRELIYDRLGLGPEAREALDKAMPSASQMDAMIVDPKNWTPWYDEDRRAAHDFYWRAYRGVLEDKGWDVDALATLDRSTTEIVQRLADPSADKGYQTKGLVVGHVQSGKTANFTGIVAKAVDAGYRLIIVLTGTIELLRGQTQRRLDMELLGEENILGSADRTDPDSIRDIDYIGTQDSDWYAGRFLKHGQDLHALPEVPEIKRLTTVDRDYRKLRLGKDTLDFRRTGEVQDISKPVYAPENIHSVDVRIAVMKKNTTALKNLLHDLKNIRADGKEIPALIIDDEADQASVNTVNPKSAEARAESRKRSAINKLISELLQQLPRAQYVGYTATPFANVFISPDDAEDLFPKDFLVSLQPSSQYMGGRYFHDLGGVPDECRGDPACSNEAAFVRNLKADGDADPAAEAGEIQAALDAFVLTGAIKKWRESIDPAKFSYRHHTMLVHESVSTAEHSELADRFREVWSLGAYSSPAGLARLREHYAKDFVRVHDSREAWADLPLPDSFDALKPYIGQAVDAITAATDPVVVVNGTKESDYNSMDFQTGPYWRVMVGGAKLSRGFTVEGLTVTYYRRKAAAADTLMQMGRWFGYRPGYGDLVRLYIARNVPGPRGKVYDLYDAFTSIIEDEEEFRDQLRKFSEIKEDGRPVVRPIHVPPLVFQQLPWLKPTGTAKMYNAVLKYEGEGGVVKDFNAHDYREDGSRNVKHFAAVKPLLQGLSEVLMFSGVNSTTYRARVGVFSTDVVLEALRSITLYAPDQLSPTISMIEKARAEGTLEDWAVVVPYLGGDYEREVEGSVVSLAERQRRPDRPGFAGSERRHRAALEVITQKPDRTAEGGENAVAYSTPTRGALLLTFAFDPVLTAEEAAKGERADRARVKRDAWPAVITSDNVATLLSLAMPYGSAPRGRIGFAVRREEDADAAIVDSY